MRPGHRHRAVAGALALGIALSAVAGCSASGADEQDGRPSVVTSFYALQYVAQRVAGRHADVVNLTQPGQEPHDVELSIRETAAVVDADVVLYERGFQAAVDDAVDQTQPEHAVDAARAADLDGDDPHFWLDPTRLARVASAFEQQLAEADPAHASAYRRNLRHLDADLTDLDAAFERGLSDCALHTVVVSHDAFGYLGRRYGLEIESINGLSPEAEPSPAHLRELHDLVAREGITTVFSEELASPALADTLAADVGVGTAVLDPVEGLGDANADQDYLSLMQANLAALRKANRCS
jgi:zinc transport system substrate-binding protein